MSEKPRKTRRSASPLTVAAILLVVTAPQLVADEARTESNEAKRQGYQLAGFNVGFGYGGHYGRHYGHHRRYHGHLRYYYPHRYHGYYGHHYPYFYGYGDSRYRYGRSSFFGALDLNVKPKKTTQVYIDGKYVGTAGDFDGWPDHLWLEKDSYELILYNPGHKTVVRHVEILPRVVIDIREEMQPGDSIPPAELTSVPPATPEPPSAAHRERNPARRELEPRHRGAPERAEPQRSSPRARPERTEPPRPGVLDVRPEPARIRLAVEPNDASIYLDGHFLGTGGEISGRDTGILIAPGEHVIEVVRPGFESREMSFSAQPGEDIDLDVELLSNASRAKLSA